MDIGATGVPILSRWMPSDLPSVLVGATGVPVLSSGGMHAIMHTDDLHFVVPQVHKNPPYQK